MLLYFVVRIAGFAMKGTSVAALLLVVALALLFYRLFHRSRRSETNLARLKELDPQIHEIYQRLEREKKLGR